MSARAVTSKLARRPLRLCLVNHAQDSDRIEQPCRVCGQPLHGDPEDQPYPPLGALCGECYRGQQMDDELDWSSALDPGAEDHFDG
jgi:hypothetical protein